MKRDELRATDVVFGSQLLPLPPDDDPRASERHLSSASLLAVEGTRPGHNVSDMYGEPKVRFRTERPIERAKSSTGNKRTHDTIPPEPARIVIANRYMVLSRIAQGGMGKVYRVKHAQLDRTFALKIMTENIAQSEASKELFYREAKIASGLSHPNIADVVDFGEDPVFGMYMVMELVTGDPLHKILFREKRLPVRVACDIVAQIADALHHIHQRDIVHCDIKTENIVVMEQVENGRRQKVAKLIDFGLARRLSQNNGTNLSGTPQYIAPERIRGEQASPASDVYALGILLYELITGKVPWDGPVDAILRGHLESVAPPPSSLVAGIDSALDALILRAISKSLSDRHSDCAMFLYELRAVMDMLGFGKRVKKPVRRATSSIAPSSALDLARVAFQRCRYPLALLQKSGDIALGNDAFSVFVLGSTRNLAGTPIESTPITRFWPNFAEDLAHAFSGHNNESVIEMRDSADTVRRVLVWLERVDDNHVQLGANLL